jgi:hypothetical protein
LRIDIREGGKRMKGLTTLMMVILLLSVVAASLAIRSADAQTGLVGYWKFEEGTGTTASDSSGNGNTGTLNNGPLWVDGKYGRALSFDGATSYVSVPASPSLNVLGNQVSAELWFKPAVTIDSNTHSACIIDKGNAYSFCLNMPPYQSTPNGRIFFIIVVGSQQYEFVETTTDVWSAGTWYHIAGTYDGDYIRIYVNGELQNSRAVTGTLWQDPTPIPFAIGAYCYGPARDWFFNGAIDEIRIYNIALSQQEILKDMQPPVGGVVVPTDKLGILAPYIGLALTTLVATVAAVTYTKRGKQRKANNAE